MGYFYFDDIEIIGCHNEDENKISFFSKLKYIAWDVKGVLRSI